MLTNKEVEKRPTTRELLCDGVVGDYVLEMYESHLNYVSEKEVCLKDEEIKKIEKEKDEEIKKKDEIIKKKDEEIKRIIEEKDREIKKIKKEKDEENKKKVEEIDKENKKKDEEIKRIIEEKDKEIKKIKKEKDEENKKKDEEIKRIIEEKDKEIERIKEDKNERTKGLKVEKDEKIKRKDEENRKEKLSPEQKPFSEVNVLTSTSALTNNLSTNFKQTQIDEKGFLFFYFFFFFIICIYSEIEFMKPLDDVKIQRTTITFTKDYEDRTIFINKVINSGIMRMFIFFYNFYIYISYFVSQVLCICTDNWDGFSMRNIFFLL
jgi:hypothetical protein